MSNVAHYAMGSWQEALSNLITDPKELFALLELDEALLAGADQAVEQFPLRVPRSYVARMQKGNINDPLLRQILPLGIELDVLSGYIADPLQESKANPIPGLLHKYYGRVLITLTSACAIHCRYCFRRHFPYTDNNPGKQGLKKIIDYLAQHTSISEVILSGGDPLAVNDKVLHTLSDELNTLSHIKRLRIHTRLPIVLPERVTDSLLSWFKQLRQAAIIVVHVNHAQEIDWAVKQALHRLHDANVVLLNQSVLLKNINDEVSTLATLSEQLFAAKVMPYYLHVIDKVAGAAHFDMALEQALVLYQALRNILPGYLVPKLVREQAGEKAKIGL
jgi:EF-P beta-lysylation protein EpmB